MKKHTKIYFKAFGLDTGDPTQFVPSEINHVRSVDIHHIVNREDRIENLIALTRQQHLDFGDKKKYMWMLLNVHRNYLDEHNIPFDNKWFETYINKYAQEVEI